MGYIIGKKLTSKGYPAMVIVVCATIGAAIGLWQGWITLRPLWKANSKGKDKKTRGS